VFISSFRFLEGRVSLAVVESRLDGATWSVRDLHEAQDQIVSSSWLSEANTSGEAQYVPYESKSNGCPNRR
jgi:hypothetical protein